MQFQYHWQSRIIENTFFKTKILIQHLKFTIHLHDRLIVCLPESNVKVLNGREGSVVNLPDETSKTPRRALPSCWSGGTCLGRTPQGHNICYNLVGRICNEGSWNFGIKKNIVIKVPYPFCFLLHVCQEWQHAFLKHQIAPGWSALHPADTISLSVCPTTCLWRDAGRWSSGWRSCRGWSSTQTPSNCRTSSCF